MGERAREVWIMALGMIALCTLAYFISSCAEKQEVACSAKVATLEARLDEYRQQNHCRKEEK